MQEISYKIMNKDRLLKVVQYLRNEPFDTREFNFCIFNCGPYDENGRGKMGDAVGDFPHIFAEWGYAKTKDDCYIPLMRGSVINADYKFKVLMQQLVEFFNLTDGEITYLFWPSPIGLPATVDNLDLANHILAFINRKENGHTAILPTYINRNEDTEA